MRLIFNCFTILISVNWEKKKNKQQKQLTQILKLIQIMKHLLLVVILIINLNSDTVGLNCYRWDNDYKSCDDPFESPCAFDHEEFCITYFHRGSSKTRFEDCGKDISLSKSCNNFADRVFTCKSTGIYEIDT